MTNLKKFLFLIPGILVSSYLELTAQEDCSLKLREAQEMFSTGRIERVYELLKNCIESGLTKEEQLQAYKLMINACIFDDNPSLAESYMFDFLKRYPDYTPNSADPVEFSNLLRQYDNLPRYSFGFSGGLIRSRIGVIDYHGVYDLTNVSGKYSPSGFGFHAGFLLSKHYGRHIDLGLEPRFRQVRYDFNVQPFPFAVVDFNEIQNRIDIPLSFSYTAMKGNIHPYFKIAWSFGLLLSAKSDMKRSYRNTDGIYYNDIQSPPINITQSRIPVNMGYAIGGGIKYKVSKGFLFLDTSFNYTFFNEVNKNQRNSDVDDQRFLYYYADNDFRINYFFLAAGYVYSFYKPRKIL